jgi:uncharacterized phiE125 gp8 family phage protein
VSFNQPAFWSRGQQYEPAPHVVSVLVTPPVLELMTLAEAKLRAGLQGAWIDGDPRDGLMRGFLATAIQQVQHDTGIALLEQSYDVFCDAVPRGPLALPWRPIQSVVVTSTNSAGVATILEASNYVLDKSSVAPTPARIALTDAGAWPTDVRTFQPWAFRIVVGFASVDLLRATAPGLIDAVGLLVAHLATAGRDRFTESALRDGYDELIAPYRLVTVA